MSTSPEVSVVIPNYNGASVLDACLASLAGQTFRPFEVLLVDNGSSDESPARFAAWRPPEGIVKRTIRLKTNRGFAAAVNAGIRAAKAPLLCLLNNDTEGEPDWLAVLVERLRRRPEIGWCGAKLLVHGERGTLDTAGHGCSTAGMGFALGRWARDGNGWNEEREVFGACAAAALYRREALETAGLFDEDFFCYQEDLDLDCRLQLAGYRCLYVPSAVVYHKGSYTARHIGNAFVTRLSSRNQLWLYVKTMPGRLLWTRLPAHLALSLLRGLAYAVKGTGGAFLRGKAEAVLGLRRAWAKRRLVQARRRISPQTFLRKLDPRWFRLQFVNPALHWWRGRGR